MPIFQQGFSGGGTPSTGVPDGTITLPKLANFASGPSVLGKNTSGAGAPVLLSMAVLRALLGVDLTNNTADADKPMTLEVSNALAALADAIQGVFSIVDNESFIVIHDNTAIGVASGNGQVLRRGLAGGPLEAVSLTDEQTIGNTNGNWTAGKTVLRQTAALTANHTTTLPAANAYTKGEIITYIDVVTGTAAFGRVFSRAGSDTLNGGTSAITARSQARFETNGVDAWTQLDKVLIVNVLQDGADPSKQANFDLSLVETGTLVTIVVPLVGGVVVTPSTALSGQFMRGIGEDGVPLFGTPASGGTGYCALIVDSKTNGTDGGTFTAGSWQTRVLNTIKSDAGSIASLSSNQVTLAAGTYRFTGRAPAIHVGHHKCRIYDVTNSVVLGYGNNQYASDIGYYALSESTVICRATFTGTTVIRLEHRCGVTEATDGLGNANSFGVEEIYATLLIEKE